MNVQRLLTILETEEVDGRNPPDMRRVLRDQRVTLMATVSHGDNAAIAKRYAHALDVARMWDVELNEA